HVFSKSRINCIILPKGTSQIREYAFKDIGDVNKLFIPSGAKLDSNAIKLNRHSNTVTVFYVVKDSDAENYCKKNKFNHRSFSSDDEAYESISGKLNELSDTNKNKIKLFYSGTKDIFTKELTDDKYIGHALELTNINKLIDSNCVLEFPQIKLDMRKIKPLYKASELRSLLLDYSVEYASDQELLAAYCPNESALPNEFKSICNMITNCARNWNSSLISLDNLKKIFDKAVEVRKGVTLDLHNIIYTKDYQISVITARVKDEYSNYIIISFYFVRISGNIVFTTFTDDDAYCNIYDIFKKYNIGAKKERIKIIKESADESKDASESLLKNVGNIDNILNINDVLLPGAYGANSDISGVQITNLMNTRLYEIYKYQLLPIALNSSPTKLNREAILLNIYTGTVYKVQFKNDTAIYSHDLYKYGISVINKWGINDIDYEDISKLTMKDTDSNRVINEIVVGNTFDPELITRPNAYDKIEPCFEYKLSQYYIKNNVKTIDDLELHDSISSKQLELIFSTAYFTKENNKSNYKIYSKREFCLVDCTNKLIQANLQNRKTANIIGAQCEYVYYIQNQYGEVVDDTLYLSSVNIREAVRQISGIAVNAESADKYGFITGKSISTSSFTAIKAIVLRGTNSIRLSIHKGNGVPYIIYGNSSYSIPVFRFRNLSEAAEFCKNLTLNKSVKYNGKVASQYPASDLAYFVDYLDGQYNKKPVSPYSKIYDYMINGFPNGYEPLGAEGNLFKLLAKQPK
ncbi:MAG: hypothetical protein IJ593_12420, partial [Lachnospiraceae bacterium]|nr:hypothetical protein [Lachnospiraceae bacterium]